MNDLTITLSNPTHDPGQTHHIDFDVVVGRTAYAATCTAKDTEGGVHNEDPCVSTYWRDREVEWDGLLIKEDGGTLPVHPSFRRDVMTELDKQLSRL